MKDTPLILQQKTPTVYDHINRFKAIKSILNKNLGPSSRRKPQRSRKQNLISFVLPYSPGASPPRAGLPDEVSNDGGS